MMADYLEILSYTNPKQNEIKQIEHKNLYDDYFIGTAKLWKNYDSQIDSIKTVILEEYFLRMIKHHILKYLKNLELKL